jgi:Flp pilus assembly protein TadB
MLILSFLIDQSKQISATVPTNNFATLLITILGSISIFILKPNKLSQALKKTPYRLLLFLFGVIVFAVIIGIAFCSFLLGLMALIVPLLLLLIVVKVVRKKMKQH